MHLLGLEERNKSLLNVRFGRLEEELGSDAQVTAAGACIRSTEGVQGTLA